MIILSGGDSFTFGAELSDQNYERASSISWAALLAKKFNFEHETVAFGGIGNDSIARLVITRASELKKEKKKFAVAIMWTFTGRIELRVNQKWYQLNDWVFWDSMEKFRTDWSHLPEKVFNSLQSRLQGVRDEGTLPLLRDYMKYTVLTGEYAIIKSYQSIYLTAQYLKQHNIPFFFVNAVDRAVGITREHTLPDVAPYFNSIDPTDWIPVPSFYEWAKEHNYEIGPADHPLDRAHADYTKLILETGLVESKWQLK